MLVRTQSGESPDNGIIQLLLKPGSTGGLKNFSYADRQSVEQVRVQCLANRQVVARANLENLAVCERSERTTGDWREGRAVGHGRRLLLLVKHWMLAADNLSRKWGDDMSRMSCDESTELFAGR